MRFVDSTVARTGSNAQPVSNLPQTPTGMCGNNA